MNRSWVISGALAALGVGCGAYLLHGRPGPALVSAQKTNICVVDAKRGDISQIISASGTVSGNSALVVECKASGEVVKLPVLVGDFVKKGEVIFQLDPSQEQTAVDQAKSALSRAVQNLEKTQQLAKLAEDDMEMSLEQADESINSLRVKATNLRNKADRQKVLLEQSLSSQEEFETAETEASEAGTEFRNAILAKRELKDRSDMLKTQKAMEVEAFEDDVRNDEVAVKNADDRLNSTTITAPMDGVISDLKTALNTWIEQSGGEYASEPVMTICDLSRIFVNVSVGEGKIGLVHAGEKVEISADSYPGRSFSGVVVGVSPTGVTGGDGVTFGVKVEVTGADKSLLKPPMTATARIVQETRADVLLVPNRAVEHGDKGAFVTVMGKDGRQQDRTVQLGISDGANDEIVGGLAAGDRVVVKGASTSLEMAKSVNE